MQPEKTVTLLLEAPLSPSEDPEKVIQAMKRVLGDAEHSLEVSSRLVRIASTDRRGLRILHDQLRDRHVRSAARRLMLSRKIGDSTTILLNRQAATVGVIALCATEGESPLGPISFTISSGDIDGVIEHLTAYRTG